MQLNTVHKAAFTRLRTHGRVYKTAFTRPARFGRELMHYRLIYSRSVIFSLETIPVSPSPITQPPVDAPILVNHASSFAAMLKQLRGQPLLAVDTESNSLYRYYPKVCLIQITTFADLVQPDPARVVDYLVDSLALTQLGALGELFQDPNVEVIMHAAENDILTLQRDFGFHFANLFDTQLAARILGWKQVGLAAILQENFGVVSDKRMQRTDWGKRPLTPQQILYAQMDTHFLPALRTTLIEQLQAAQRWEEAQEAFTMFQHLNYHGRESAPRAFWQMKQVREVARKDAAILQALWQWREEEAQRRDRPPFKIMTDQTLIHLVNQQPKSLHELLQIPGLGDIQGKQYGKVLLATIVKGQAAPLPEHAPAPERLEQGLERAVQQRYDALRQWRSQAAEQRGVQPEIVFSNTILLAIAQRLPQSEKELIEIPEIGPWKARTYGPAILATLHGKG